MYGGGFGGFGGFDQQDQGPPPPPGGGGFLGGFFPSPQKAGGGHSPSMGRKEQSSSSRDVQGLVAATIKMVLDAAASADGAEANLVRLHGHHEASMVELVGQVEAVDDSEQMFARYVIDDGTGKMVCKKFVDAEKQRDVRVAVGKFVKVIGPFRRFGSESYVNAHRVEEVRNLDDIARHRIEVIHTFLQLTGQLDENSGAVSGMHASMSSVNAPSEMNYRENTTPNVAAVGSNQWFLNEVQRFFGPRGSKYNGNGFSRQQLCIQFATTLSSKQVDEKVQFLHDEGHMYSTIDDNHFQLTGC